MLLKIVNYNALNARKLMDIYSESNIENAEYFYPEEENKEAAVRKVESGFLDYLKEKFFKRLQAAYWVFEQNGEWISALRTCEVQNDLYYLEALETRPDQRGKGYGSFLLLSVLETMKAGASFRLCDCVSKTNAASLKTHKKCGFQIVSEKGYDYLREEADDNDFGLEYRHLEE